MMTQDGNSQGNNERLKPLKMPIDVADALKGAMGVGPPDAEDDPDNDTPDARNNDAEPADDHQ